MGGLGREGRVGGRGEEECVWVGGEKLWWRWLANCCCVLAGGFEGFNMGMCESFYCSCVQYYDCGCKIGNRESTYESMVRRVNGCF